MPKPLNKTKAVKNIGSLDAVQKPIQEQLGQALMDAVSEFARRDIGTSDEITKKYFHHISDNQLQKDLTETLYGARWLYKLGLAVLAAKQEKAAHIRAQVIDYAAICEAVLADVIFQGSLKGKLAGDQYKYASTNSTSASPKLIDWTVTDEKKIKRSVYATSFEWRIKVAEQSSIIDSQLAEAITTMRKNRNSVHLTNKIGKNTKYILKMAIDANSTINELAKQTQKYVAQL